MNCTAFSIDLAKNKFQVHGYDERNQRCLVKTLSRAQLLPFFRERPQTTARVALEACGGAHAISRQLMALGYQVIQIPTQHVAPFRRGNKNDANDADAIHEAALRPQLRPVPVKTVEQQDAMLAHLSLERLKKTRLELTNQMRGVLQERGVVFPQRPHALRNGVRELLARPLEGELTGRLAEWLLNALAEWAQLEARMAAEERVLKRTLAHCELAQRLAELDGIGIKTATALTAKVTDPTCFPSARAFAAWTGNTPREHASGQQRFLGAITRRGDTYLRTLFVHGGRSLLQTALRKQRLERPLNPLETWLIGVYQRRGYNRAVVAAANKNARRAWAVLVGRKPNRRPMAQTLD